MLSGTAVTRKSAIIKALLREPDLLPSRRSVKRSMAELDQLHSDLEDRGDGRIVNVDPAGYTSPGRSDAATTTTTSAAASTDTADHPLWSAVGPLSAGPPVLLDPGRRIPRDAGESVMCSPESHNISSWLTFDDNIFAHLRQELLRLVSRLRIVIRLRLIFVLSGLSRIPNAVNFVLLLLAAVRCYGRRTEPSDYTLPVLTSMSVVTGEAARLC
jgi:hypothetical protein